jgi:hypothetical protein
MNYLEFKKEFDKLSPEEQWKRIVPFKDIISFKLDNDCTSFEFINETELGYRTCFYMKADIGDRYGIKMLLNALGINAEYV